MKSILAILVLLFFLSCGHEGVNPYTTENTPIITDVVKDGYAYILYFELPPNTTTPDGGYEIYINSNDVDLIVVESPVTITDNLIFVNTPGLYFENCFEVEARYLGSGNFLRTDYTCK